jgi:hypothetical protein
MRPLPLRTRLRQLVRASRKASSGRILAVKWGLNPNSSSLGVDVTFLLFGAAAVSLVTPVVAALLRWRKPALASVAAPPDRELAPGAGNDAGDDAGHDARHEARDAGAGARP